MRASLFSASTTAADLWNALAAASGKPVAAIASAYTSESINPYNLVNAAHFEGISASMNRGTGVVHVDHRPRHFE
jgi:hypothetical protein